MWRRRLYYQELVDRAAEKAAKEKKRAAKAAEAFTDLLRSTRAIKTGMSWEDARPELSSHRDYLPVSLPPFHTASPFIWPLNAPMHTHTPVVQIQPCWCSLQVRSDRHDCM